MLYFISKVVNLVYIVSSTPQAKKVFIQKLLNKVYWLGVARMLQV